LRESLLCANSFLCEDLWTNPELARAFNQHYEQMKERMDRPLSDEEKARAELRRKQMEEEMAKKKKEQEEAELISKRLKDAQVQHSSTEHAHGPVPVPTTLTTTCK
jgi:hypothetical protein